VSGRGDQGRQFFEERKDSPRSELVGQSINTITNADRNIPLAKTPASRQEDWRRQLFTTTEQIVETRRDYSPDNCYFSDLRHHPDVPEYRVTD
jgi:hypothetical protein